MASPTTPFPDALAEALKENQQLKNALAQQSAAASSASEQLRQFLYAASHDLQEPLRGIITYAQLLERQFAADKESHEYTEFILSSAQRMRSLLQQVAVYARAGLAKQRRTTNLNVPLQMALLKLAAEIRATGAKISHQPLPEAIADENEIFQVFDHIISNALKFRSGAAPEVNITAEQGTDECTITVRDNGAGIDPRFCEQALLPFKRLHGHEISGVGLGLAICSKIVQAHRGRLWLESDGANGASVHFTLPI